MKAAAGEVIDIDMTGYRSGGLNSLGKMKTLPSGRIVCVVAQGGHFSWDPELPDPGGRGEWRPVDFPSGCIYPFGGTSIYAWCPESENLEESEERLHNPGSLSEQK